MITETEKDKIKKDVSYLYYAGLEMNSCTPNALSMADFYAVEMARFALARLDRVRKRCETMALIMESQELAPLKKLPPEPTTREPIPGPEVTHDLAADDLASAFDSPAPAISPATRTPIPGANLKASNLEITLRDLHHDLSAIAAPPVDLAKPSAAQTFAPLGDHSKPLAAKKKTVEDKKGRKKSR